MTTEDIKATLSSLNKEQTIALIRKTLGFPKAVTKSIRASSEDHYRFDMTGEDGKEAGSNTIHNQTILNKFASWGIYNYTKFITIDFYKGHGTIYFCYWNEDNNQEVDMGGCGTCEIIYEVLLRTILSDKPQRRR